MKNLCFELITVCMMTSVLFITVLLIKPFTNKHLSASWHFNTLKVIIMMFFIPVHLVIRKVIVLLDLQWYTISMVDVPNTTSDTAITFLQRMELGEAMEVTIQHGLYSYSDVLLLLWVIGICIILGWKMYCFFRFTREVIQSAKTIDSKTLEILTDCKTKLKVKSNVFVFRCDCLYSPMLVGFINQKILLPKKAISPNNLEYVFTHELIHFKRKDLWWEMLLEVATILFWFNPILYLFKIEFDKQLEYSCDEKVVGELSYENKKKYGFAILESISEANIKSKKIFGVGLITPQQKLEMRLTKMLKFKTMQKGTKIFLTTIAVVLIVMTTSVPAIAIVQFATNVIETTEEENDMSVISDLSVYHTSDENYIAQPTEYMTNNIVLPHDNFVGKHEIEVDSTMLYKLKGDEPFNFDKSDDITIELQIDDMGFDTGQGISIGYFFNGNTEKTQLFSKQIKDNIKINFVAEKTGEYIFYVECRSSDPITVNSFYVE